MVHCVKRIVTYIANKSIYTRKCEINDIRIWRLCIEKNDDEWRRSVPWISV